MGIERTCSLDGCERKHLASGLCQLHYMRKRRGQDLDAPLRRERAEGQCSGPECDREVKAKGFCEAHYQQQWKGQELKPLREPPKQGCDFPGCDRPHTARGYCAPHHKQWLAGKEMEPIKPMRTQGPWLRDAVASATPGECIEWPFKLRDSGHPASVSFEGTSVSPLVLALELHGLPRPEGQVPAHGPCHNPSCVNPHHLEWKTPYENHMDRWRDGTMLFGSDHWHSKLSEEERELIVTSSATRPELAERFGVTIGTIGNVRRKHRTMVQFEEICARHGIDDEARFELRQIMRLI